MKTFFILSFTLLFFQHAQSQNVPKNGTPKYEYVYSKDQLRDFADAAFFQYRYGTNKMFKVLIDRTFLNRGFTAIDAAAAIENIQIDKEGGEIIFRAFADQFRNADMIAKNIYLLGTSAKTARDIANFIYQTYFVKLDQ